MSSYNISPLQRVSSSALLSAATAAPGAVESSATQASLSGVLAIDRIRNAIFKYVPMSSYPNIRTVDRSCYNAVDSDRSTDPFSANKKKLYWPNLYKHPLLSSVVVQYLNLNIHRSSTSNQRRDALETLHQAINAANTAAPYKNISKLQALIKPSQEIGLLRELVNQRSTLFNHPPTGEDPFISAMLTLPSIDAESLGQALIKAPQHKRKQSFKLIVNSSRFEKISVKDLGEALFQAVYWNRKKHAKLLINSSRFGDISKGDLGHVLKVAAIWGLTRGLKFLINSPRFGDISGEDFKEALDRSQCFGHKKCEALLKNSLRRQAESVGRALIKAPKPQRKQSFKLIVNSSRLKEMRKKALEKWNRKKYVTLLINPLKRQRDQRRLLAADPRDI